ncbi:MAG: signal peptide peptidase SppA [Gammaproteobacteria bacterium]|nr:signal peptide peptidase SppA [Gammaproteobacteria bacterium]
MSERNVLVRFLSAVWGGLDGIRKVLHLLLLLIVFLGFLGALAGNAPIIPNQAALLIQPVGSLVDQLDGDPYDRAVAELVGDAQQQTLVQGLVDALAYAKDDERISAVHLELSYLGGAGLSKLRRVAAAIGDFQDSGKPVVASGDYYSQQAFYLAAFADEVYMHPEGLVFLQGYGSYRNYYKEALDTLRVDWNVFRVGTHKSFVEPYTRMDMSPEDRESRSRLITQFWDMYQHDVDAARGLDSGSIDDFAQNLVEHVEAAGGDIAIASRDAGLVDDLLSRAELRDVLKQYAGEDGQDDTMYSAVHSSDYLSQMSLLHGDDVRDENVAVIVAAGEILDGFQSPGTIGGDSTAALLRNALGDDSVQAVVLRVDSPGGSVFASEVIAHEVRALQAAGKPVVASMSSVAASGGYWISVVADRVIASEATVTGSIGVFGMFPTYHRTLDAIGVATDGVGTTPWAGQLRPDVAMSEPMKQVFQLLINDTYDDFISGVATARAMDKTAVDSVAQGQVWTGRDALQHGLIDELGNLSDSIRVAAELAGMEEGSYGQKRIQPSLSPSEQMILDFLALSQRAGLDWLSLSGKQSALQVITDRLEALLASVARFNDPKAIYSHCFCEIN